MALVNITNIYDGRDIADQLKNISGKLDKIIESGNDKENIKKLTNDLKASSDILKKSFESKQ